MPDYTANWNGTSITQAAAQKVYLRQNWSTYSTPGDYTSPLHHVDWTYYPNMWCESATWSLLPTMPSATLSFRYGDQIPYGDGSATILPKLAVAGWYVKVEFYTGELSTEPPNDPLPPLTWYGFIDELADIQGGNVGGIATGTQQFVCYSMAQLLAMQTIRGSRWLQKKRAAGTEDDLAHSLVGIPFNQFGRGNRTKVYPQVSDGGGGTTTAAAHSFSPLAPKNRWQSGTDEPFPETDYWSTADIIEYLIDYWKPVDYQGNARIPFTFADGVSPIYDRPTLQTEGRSVLSVLSQLVNTSRMSQLSVDVLERTTSDPTDLDTVQIRVNSLSDTTITLPDGNTHPENDQRLFITSLDAQDTATVVQTSTTDIHSAVLAKGARKEHCMHASINSVDAPAANGFPLVECWTTDEETQFNDGAKPPVTPQATWDGWTTAEKSAANQRARSVESLNDVFRTFVIDPRWEGKDDKGNQVFGLLLDQIQMPPPGEGYWSNTTPYQPYPNALKIKTVIPLREKVDYSQNPIPADDQELEFRRPMIAQLNPLTLSYAVGEKQADGEEIQFGIGSANWKEGQGIQLNVLGAKQQFLAKQRFTGNEGDDDDLQEIEFDYFDAVLTISLEYDSYLQQNYFIGGNAPGNQNLPDDEALVTQADMFRPKVVYAGEGYRYITISDETNVDVNVDGNLITSAAGQTLLVDDSDELRALATIAAEWYLRPRYVFRLQSARPSTVPRVGMLLKTANGQAIDTVVSQISIIQRLGYNQRNTPAQYRLQTARGEVDIAHFNPRLRSQTSPIGGTGPVVSSPVLTNAFVGPAAPADLAERRINEQLRSIMSQSQLLPPAAAQQRREERARADDFYKSFADGQEPFRP